MTNGLNQTKLHMSACRKELRALTKSLLDSATQNKDEAEVMAIAQQYHYVICDVIEDAVTKVNDTELCSLVEAMQPDYAANLWIGLAKKIKDNKKKEAAAQTTTTTVKVKSDSSKDSRAKFSRLFHTLRLEEAEAALQVKKSRTTWSMDEKQADKWLEAHSQESVQFDKLTDKGTYIIMQGYHSALDLGGVQSYQTPGWETVVGSNPSNVRSLQYKDAKYKVILGRVDRTCNLYKDWEASNAYVSNVVSVAHSEYYQRDAFKAAKHVAKNAQHGVELVVYTHEFNHTVSALVAEVLKHGTKVTVTVEDLGRSYDTCEVLGSNGSPIDLGVFNVNRTLVVHYNATNRLAAIKTMRLAMDKRRDLQRAANEKIDVVLKEINTDARTFHQSRHYERAVAYSNFSLGDAVDTMQKATGQFLTLTAKNVQSALKVHKAMFNYILEFGPRYGIYSQFDVSDFTKFTNSYGNDIVYRDYVSNSKCTDFLGKKMCDIKKESRPGYAGNDEYKPNPEFDDTNLQEKRVQRAGIARAEREGFLVDLLQEFATVWNFVNSSASELYYEGFVTCPNCGYVHNAGSIGSPNATPKETGKQIAYSDYADVIVSTCPACGFETEEMRASGLAYNDEMTKDADMVDWNVVYIEDLRVDEESEEEELQ